MTTLLLTGATGFLGSHILKGLIEKMNYNVVILKRSFSNTERIDQFLSNPRIKYYDLDKTNLEDIFKQNKIDIIIHTATEYGKNHASNLHVLETNLMFPIKLVELGIEHGCKSFINTDSFFNKEGLSYSYLLNYSLSKKSLLMWLNYYSKKINIINIVLEHIYGQNDNPDKFTEYMIRKIAIEQVPEIDLTQGNQERDFVYIEDIVDAYIKIIAYSLTHDEKLTTFELGTSNPIKLKSFIEKIKELSNSQTHLNFGALPYREDEIMFSKADISTLSELYWTPKFNIENGLRKIITRYKEEST